MNVLPERNTIFCSEDFVAMFGYSKAEVFAKNKGGQLEFLHVSSSLSQIHMCTIECCVILYPYSIPTLRCFPIGMRKISKTEFKCLCKCP